MEKKKIKPEELKKIELDLIKKFGREAQLDGILNLEEFNKTSPRILWILKEPNAGYKDDIYSIDNENLNDEEAESIWEKLKEKKEEYYNDVTKIKTGYTLWKRTFKNISYITRGVIEKEFKWDYIPDINNEAKIDGKYYVNKIALINLKKVPGDSNSNDAKIAEFYEDKSRSFILKQIEFINPDIIFNCSRCYQVFEDLRGENPINDDHEFQFAINNGRIIINTKHPARKNEIDYVDSNLEIIEQHYKY